MCRIPELLVPAGGMEQLKAAVACGADAVYVGGVSFSARAHAANFSDEELQEAILEKMRGNGPVTDYMLGTVKENTHHGSLVNWLRSFR